MPAHIDARYPAIPPRVRLFIEHLDECTRSGEQVWFLTFADYSAAAGSTTAWNEWENLASEENQDPEISAFWDRHLPILHSYLAVCVDRASADYGKIVRGDAPEFRETIKVCDSFDELLAQIVRMQQGDEPDDLAGLFLDPYDDRNLRSRPRCFFDRIADRLRSLPVFERYRIGVVLETVVSRPLWNRENWSKIMPPLTAVIKGLGAEAVISPRQSGDYDNCCPSGDCRGAGRTFSGASISPPTRRNSLCERFSAIPPTPPSSGAGEKMDGSDRLTMDWIEVVRVRFYRGQKSIEALGCRASDGGGEREAGVSGRRG